MSTIKRVYLYTVSIITLGIFAAGGQILLRLVFDIIKGTTLVRIEEPGFIQAQLSLGLAMLVIGGVLWFLFWRVIQRQVSGNPAEVGAAIRKLFLNIIILVTALNGLSAAAQVLNWLMAGVPRELFSPEHLATFIVAGSIWYGYWRLSEKEGQPSPAALTLRRWYVYILSGWGLVALSVGLVQLINQAILSLPVWGEAITGGDFWTSGLCDNLSWILLGGFAWVFHWFCMARADSDSTLRQIYLYLLAVLGGAVAGLVALTNVLFGVFRFSLGSLDVTPAAHFQFVGWAAPLLLVGAAVWAYHQKVVQEEEAQLHKRPLSARRVLFYLMSFIGLGTLVSGLIILLGMLLELLAGSVSGGVVVVSPGWWRQQLSLCLALLLVALPIWLYYWNGVLRMIAGSDVAERMVWSRRIFLYVVVGAAIIALAADLINIVYQVLNGLLQGTFGVEVLQGSKWSLQTLVVAVPVLWYHWRIMRQDQHLGAEKLPPRKTVTILAGEPAQDLVAMIEERLGSRVRQLRYLGQAAEDIPAMSDEETDQLVSEIRAVPGDKVMVIIAGGKVTVVPYSEK